MAIDARRRHVERGPREFVKSHGYRPPWDSNGTALSDISETSLTRVTIATRTS